MTKATNVEGLWGNGVWGDGKRFEEILQTRKKGGEKPFLFRVNPYKPS